jgi:hypothetical protein
MVFTCNLNDAHILSQHVYVAVEVGHRGGRGSNV